jgi:DNA invertase Pin-like site-specific DNA recombinase
MGKQKLTILYERLSKEDGEDSVSNSITNQRTLLEEYAEKNGLKPYIHIQDDGYSGTDWDRPGWQELITKIDNGEVQNLIVKDSSRIGRDYLRVGLYREMFSERKIRLIAVNDGIDTLHGDDDFTPFREIMAEWYARDTSKKIKSAFKTKGQSGKPITGKPPYGYIKDPNDKYKWLVDEEAAEVVRRIFDLTVDGKCLEEICRILHSEKVERPSYYSVKRGQINFDKALGADDPYLWRTNVIRLILARQEYLGHLVNFRYSKPSYKSKRMVKNPKDEWLIFENSHEPIVDKETWELAQRIRKTVKRTDTTGEANPLTGLIFCADCGGKMYNHRSKNDHYTCPGFVKGRTEFKESHCPPHYVNTALVRAVLLDIIKRTSEYAQQREAEFAEKIREMHSIRKGETLKVHNKQLSKNKRRIAELDKLFTNLYEDKVSGALSAERFSQMSDRFEQEQAELITQNETLQSEIDTFVEKVLLTSHSTRVLASLVPPSPETISDQQGNEEMAQGGDNAVTTHTVDISAHRTHTYIKTRRNSTE